MEVIGKIKLINDTQSFGSNGFTKREVVVTTEEQYPQMIMIEFVQDKCALLDNFQVDQNVKISINLRGREWVNPEGVAKYFNSIQGWRIEAVENGGAQGAPAETAPPEFVQNEGEATDDLPF